MGRFPLDSQKMMNDGCRTDLEETGMDGYEQ